MKAERRHDLKTNALATKLISLPETWRRLIGRFILGAGLAVALGIAIATWHNRSVEKAQRLQDDLAVAFDRISDLKGLPNSGVNRTFNEVLDLLNEVAAESTDPKLLAQAGLLKGDLYWTLAVTYWLPSDQPVLSGADVDFELIPAHHRRPLIESASTEYKSVVDHYPQQTLPVIRAEFGMAAIAEDAGTCSPVNSDFAVASWQFAQSQYAAIIKKAGDAPEYQWYRQLAVDRFNSMRQLSIPVLLGTPKEPLPATTQSTTTQSATTQMAATQSAAHRPATSPATLPGTPATLPMPAAPATRAAAPIPASRS